jgi:hypothetical protein
MRPVGIPDDGYRRGTAPVRRQAACRCGGIRGISNVLMRNNIKRVQIIRARTSGLVEVTCVTM